ncbi:serine protease 1-like [Drosophila innubila]|uniref:serine protease 1-like n=1 Tax=Drosophila innubila TaxID=198719 RepID=UPI00148E73D3|nr:serine protease 1-like [Drosophila innubila]
MQKCLKDIVIVLLLNCLPIFSTEVQTLKPKLLRIIPLLTEEDNHFDSGYVAGPTEISYIVALEFSNQRSSWFCAGSIIAHRWILTVASCTNPASRVKINFGASDRQQSSYHVLVSSKSFFAHPDFNRFYQHDIALIHMPYIVYSKNVKFVALPSSRSLFTGEWALSAGWGQHKGTQKQMSKLHVVQIQVLANSNCSKLGYGKRFRSGMLCALLPNMETSCRLDSGSPIVLQASDTLIGIASFGNQIGCKSHTPLGYTRLTAYMDWMATVMSENG